MQAEQKSKSDDYQATAVFIERQGRVMLRWDEVIDLDTGQ